MTTWEWVAIAAVALIGLAAIMIVLRIRRRRVRLADMFGSEYDRTVAGSSPRAAERRLAEVQKEHEALDVREIAPVARERYLHEWHEAERRFVNDPADSVRSAERIVVRLLEERGYPSDGDQDGAAPHVAIDHPDAFERYRQARTAMADVNGDETERLRRAMLDYRVAFEDLLGERRTAA